MSCRVLRALAPVVLIATIGCASNPAMRPHAAARADREATDPAPPGEDATVLPVDDRVIADESNARPSAKAEPLRMAPESPSTGTLDIAPSAPRAASGGWTPVAGADTSNVISQFGDPRGSSRRHEGIDIAAPRGTAVLAPAAGTVLVSGIRSLGGNVVVVSSLGGEYEWVFSHLDARTVSRGDRLGAGDLIGYVGTSGNAAGGPPHLHFEVHTRGQPVDPLPLLAPDRPRGR
ncbi:MAG: peptidoglycan DD-metalloendopeptidase family protein [Acidobacteria bacterium]|nr:peptidoglycan DD-metalloendopeptidase family protein [Acidobacteriota bacterium]